MSGSVFAFSMFSDPAGIMPVLTSDTTDGFAFTIDVNLDGSTTVNDFSSQATVGAAGAGQPSSTPEPGSASANGELSWSCCTCGGGATVAFEWI